MNNQGSSHNLRSCSIWRKKKNTGLSFLKTTVRTVIHLFNILSSNCVSDRDITLPTKVRTVKAMVFPVVMYEFERWITKKAECWRIDAFELWCWKRLMRVPWTVTDQTSQSILKEINPEYSLEGLMLKLTLQYFWPPDAKSWLIWENPDAGKGWRQEEKGTTENEMVGWHHWLKGHEFE